MDKCVKKKGDQAATAAMPSCTGVQPKGGGLMKRRALFCIVRHRIHQISTHMYETVYLGLDAHTRTCVLAVMGSDGPLILLKEFKTSEAGLIHYVTSIRARAKYLAVEESSLAGWIAGTLRPYVTELIVCDPRHNSLISRSGNKDDFTDAFNLCRLLRLGELVPVYHGDDLARTDFKIAVQQYLSFRDDHAKLKRQIKGKYQQAGMVGVMGTGVFSKKYRDSYLDELPTRARRGIMERLYSGLDAAGRLRKESYNAMVELGRRYPEIKKFQRVPGIGVLGSHVFSAFIQTPDRFATKQQLWSYCRLGILERSSAGKPLAYKRLNHSGSGTLKAMSYQCWQSALRTKEPNEVSLFYKASLERTGDKVHARLNTQRKVLAVLWTIWKNDVGYNPKLLYSSPTSAVITQAAATP